MAVHSSASIGSSIGQTKRKEIYKYEAQWTVYSMNWSVRPDKRFRLALGSFIEEYNNKVSDVFVFVLSGHLCMSVSSTNVLSLLNPFSNKTQIFPHFLQLVFD